MSRVHDPSEFFALLTSPALNVTDVDIVNDKTNESSITSLRRNL